MWRQPLGNCRPPLHGGADDRDEGGHAERGAGADAAIECGDLVLVRIIARPNNGAAASAKATPIPIFAQCAPAPRPEAAPATSRAPARDQTG